MQNFKLGDMFYDTSYDCMCCLVDPNDVDWGVEYNEGIRNGNKYVILYLDEGEPQYGSESIAEQLFEVDKQLVPTNEDQLALYLMIAPHIDFTYWRKLYGRA